MAGSGVEGANRFLKRVEPVNEHTAKGKADDLEISQLSNAMSCAEMYIKPLQKSQMTLNVDKPLILRLPQLWS